MVHSRIAVLGEVPTRRRLERLDSGSHNGKGSLLREAGASKLAPTFTLVRSEADPPEEDTNVICCPWRLKHKRRHHGRGIR